MVSVKNIVITISIAIVFLFFAIYGVRTFMTEPVREDYCKDSMYAKPYPCYGDKCGANCSFNKAFEDQRQQCYRDGGYSESEYDNKGCETNVSCNFCDKEYNDVMKEYSRIVFIISTIVGILGIAVGAVIFGVETVGSGLMIGGIMFFTYGTIRYWQHIPDVGRFTLLGISLVILVYIGMWLNKKRQGMDMNLPFMKKKAKRRKSKK